MKSARTGQMEFRSSGLGVRWKMGRLAHPSLLACLCVVAACQAATLTEESKFAPMEPDQAHLQIKDRATGGTVVDRDVP